MIIIIVIIIIVVVIKCQETGILFKTNYAYRSWKTKGSGLVINLLNG